MKRLESKHIWSDGILRHEGSTSASRQRFDSVESVSSLISSGSPESYVIEQLLLLAATIARNSQDDHTVQTFLLLLRTLQDTFDTREAIPIVATRLRPSSPDEVRNADGNSADALTTRQCEVLRLRSTGLTVAQIAERLSLTPRTVHSHIRDAVVRLGVSGGVMAAIAAARMLGLI